MVAIKSETSVPKKKTKKKKDGVKKKTMEKTKEKNDKTKKKKKSVTFALPGDDSVDDLISQIRKQVEEGEEDTPDPTLNLEDDVEEDISDANKHSKLLKKFGVKERKKSLKEKTLPMEPSGKEIQGKVTVSDLVASASTKQNLTSVQQLLEVGKELETLAEPLPRFQQEQAERAVNYGKTKREVSKWQSLVKRNRETEQMVFPLFQAQQSREQKQDISSFANKRKKCTSSLEAEIYEALETDAHVLEREGHLLTEAEEQTLEALTVEEAEARRQELCRTRVLLSYQEEKLRRQNKIKSKKYRKILKKERQKKEEKALTEALRADPEAVAGGEQDKADYLRALERISQKHKVGGKWNKNLLHKKIKDPELQSAMTEQRQMRQKLMEKKDAESSSSDEGGEEQTTEPAAEPVEGPTAAEEEEEFEVDPANPWLMVGQALDEGKIALTNTVPAAKPAAKPAASPPVIVVGILDKEQQEEGEQEGGEGDDDQEALVDMAFANDDVVAQFAEEKEKIVDAETEKDVDLTLPGWGSWAGAGALPAKSQKKIIKKAPPTAPRKDAGMDHVIICTKKNRKLDQHLVRRLPHPYKNRSTFEREMRQPIGPQWNSVKAFRNMIKPGETVLDGHIIEPISVPKGFDKVPSRGGRGKRLKV